MPIESNHYLGLDGGEAAGAPVWRDRHADLLHQWPQGARGGHLRRDQIHDRAGPAAAILVVLNERMCRCWISALEVTSVNAALPIWRVKLYPTPEGPLTRENHPTPPSRLQILRRAHRAPGRARLERRGRRSQVTGVV